MNTNLPYANPERLADVMALIQVLALDQHAHRSEKGLTEELQGSPRSSEKWEQIAAQHPEFFRVAKSGTQNVSLVARHVLRKGEEGVRELPADFVGKLLAAAIELHDRQLSRSMHWKAYVPIIVAVTAGIFTVFGIWLRIWLSAPNT